MKDALMKQELEVIVPIEWGGESVTGSAKPGTVRKN